MSEATGKLVEVEKYVESLKSDIAGLEEKLATLNEQVSDAKSAKKQAESDLETARTYSEGEQQRLEAETNAKKDRLLNEQRELEASVSALKTQTAEMNKKITDFKTYESRATLVLRNKENSLVEREKAVREKENLSPLLPRR